MRPITTPGVAASSAHISRPLGIVLSCSSLKFWFTRVAEVSMIGESPVTVTVSLRVATLISTLTFAVKPSEIWIPSRLTLLKPASSKVMV